MANLCVCVNITLLLAFLLVTPASAKPPTDPATANISEITKSRIQATFLKAPLHFEPNQGQTDEPVKFLARGAGYQMFLTSTEAVMVLRQPDEKPSAISRQRSGKQSLIDPKLDTRHSELQSVVRMKLVGANPDAEVSGLDQLPGKVNYFIGNDPKKWRTNIPTYGKVKYHNVYPGVDLVYYGNQRQLEYDFVVAPGSDPKAIKLAFDGADKFERDGSDLVIRTASGSLRMHKPLVYQEVAGVKKEISAAFVLNPIENPKLASVGFQVASYDGSRPLVIDPVLSYSTYLGGGGSEFDTGGVTVDCAGNAYVTGGTISPDFPTANPVPAAHGGGADIFVAKLNSIGSELIYSTYVGGSGNEYYPALRPITVDSTGNVYITGSTTSADFPVTPGAFQAAFAGGGSDAFVTKLTATGDSLVYSTYLGGGRAGRLCCAASDLGTAVAVDLDGNAYVVGFTDADDFPVTAGVFQVAPGGGGSDGFITKLNATGSTLVYSSFIGGGSSDHPTTVAVDLTGNAYVSGSTGSANFPTTAGSYQTAYGGGENDVFITKINAQGAALLYSTFLGGSDRDDVLSMHLDDLGNVYVAGRSGASDMALIGNFPITEGAFQTVARGRIEGFVAKLNASRNNLVYSTYLGGSGSESLNGLAVDSLGQAYIAGSTDSADFPTQSPLQFYSGGNDAFVVKLNATGSALVYSTYLGGSSGDSAFSIALDCLGNAYVVGLTNSANFPTTGGAFQPVYAGGGDVFVAKITENHNHSPTASSGGPYTVAEGGTLATLNGSGSDPDGDPLTYAWDIDNNGSFETAGQNPTFSAVGRDGPSSQKVVLQVCDNRGACATSSATVNITNVAPTVVAISAPVAPVQVNALITTSATFTDPGVPDTHTAVWDWGDGTTSPGTVSEMNGSGSVSGSHVYTAAGVYTVTLTVTDDDGGSGQSVFQFVVVYDPNAGFVTGGGWISSPAGAYVANPSLTGRANFGFVSRYRPGVNVPEGQTEFQFSVANLNSHGSNYEWLVVGGARAQYKGTGTINGAGSYSFILTAIDGQVPGGGGVDKFRIKIWGSGVIYDNQMGAGDDANPTTQLGGGSIVIHTQ